jgi:hypothetical protein
MSPLVGLLKQETISNPSAVALGHLMAALTGLYDADTDTLPYLRNRVLSPIQHALMLC